MSTSRAIRLYETRTLSQLAAQLEGMEPKKIPGSLWLFTPQQKKLREDLGLAITWKLDDEKKAKF